MCVRERESKRERDVDEDILLLKVKDLSRKRLFFFFTNLSLMPYTDTQYVITGEKIKEKKSERGGETGKQARSSYHLLIL